MQIYQPKFGLAGIVPAWTLAVELSFYAALPAYAWVLGRLTNGRPPERRVVIELAGAAALYVFGLAWHLAVVTTSRAGTNAPSARWLPAMADWFALGLFLAVLRSSAEIAPVAASRGVCSIATATRRWSRRGSRSWSCATSGCR